MEKLYEGPQTKCEALYMDNPRLYFSTGKMNIWEADPWYETDRSWFESSYIHAGISGPETTFSGPDAQKMISDSCINNVWKWKIGKCKHLVQLDDNGLVLNHALFMRDGEDVFRTTAGCPYPLMPMAMSGKYNVEVKERDIFIFQFSGPTSLTIIEKVTQTDLHDVKFLDFRSVTIPGLDADFEVCRIGMSGTLAYELRGDIKYGPTVYDMAYQAGQEWGIKRLGWRDYSVNHTFGGFAQMTVNFEMSCYDDPEFVKMAPIQMHCTGSVDPADRRARFRTAVETDWAWMADFDHEFRGKEALQEELAHPKRKLVSLLWNTEDMIAVYASQFTDEPYKYMDMPCAEQQQCGGHQDYVLTKDGKRIGYSAVATYSSWFHQTISHAILDVDEIEEGKEVLVEWGDFGGKIKKMRAVIAPFPYIHGVELNQKYDVSKVPYGCK